MIRGGNRPPALAVLELAGLAAIACVLWKPSRPILTGLPMPFLWAAAVLIVTPLVQLLPVPIAFWGSLPGHAPFAQVLETAGVTGGWRPSTIRAVATQYSWLVLLPCIAIFLLVRQLDRSRLRRLVVVFVAVACVEAILGVLQAGSVPGSLIHLGNPWGGGAATGTYINRNHFAGLMAMALPMLLALWAIEMLPVVTPRGDVLREHPRNKDIKFATRAAFSALAVILLLALLLSRSRAGISAGMLAFGLAILALVWRSATAQVKVVLAMVAAGALFLAGAGLTPVLEKFAPDEVAQNAGGRWHLTTRSLAAALDFMPLGSGLGTFADVFRRYQDAGVVGFADHAHNDYAELLVELGMGGAAVIALFLVAYSIRWRAVLTEPESRRLRFLQIAAGLGMLALLAHGLFDFNFHIPANAIYFSFLAGVFFFIPSSDRA